MGTKNNPGKWDCYSRAEPDEPMFVLLGRDSCAWLIVKTWVEVKLHGLPEGERAPEKNPKLQEALMCANAMRDWAIRTKGLAAVVAAEDAFRRFVSPPCRCDGVPSPISPGARKHEYEHGFCVHCGGKAPPNV